jgi:cellobiose PTS system EIIB component
MSRRYSIAEARQDLAAIIHEAETAGPIQFTRRGQSVAVLLSQADYEQLTAGRKDFWKAYEDFRSLPDFVDVEVDPEIFTVRDISPGRDVSF